MKKKSISFENYLEICQKKKEENFTLDRPISTRLSFLFYKYNLFTANQVTLINGLILICSILVARNWNLFISYLMFGLYTILDCVDGELARAQKTAGNSGQFLENFIDVIFISTLSSYTLFVLTTFIDVNLKIILITTITLLFSYLNQTLLINEPFLKDNEVRISLSTKKLLLGTKYKKSIFGGQSFLIFFMLYFINSAPQNLTNFYLLYIAISLYFLSNLKFWIPVFLKSLKK